MGPASPRDLVRRNAQMHGQGLAVMSPGGSLSHGALADRTAALAAALRRAGVGAGVQVAMALPNSVAYLVWYFGVLEAGGIVVPLAPTIAQAEAERLLRTSGIRLLAAHEDARLPRDLGLPQAAACGPAEGACLWRGQREVPILETGPDTLVRQFSSGSTGRPKHVLKTEANVRHDYRHFCETLGLQPGERFLGVAPFHHSYGAMSFLAAFHLGGRVTVLPRFLPAPVIEAARRDRPTVFLTTPPMIEALGTCALAEGDERAFESLNVCICSTGRLSKADHDAFRARFGVRVHVQYGCTETGSAAIDMEEEFEEGRVGRPYAGVEIAVFDDAGHPCPAGQRGHIAIRSPAACGGYVGDPETTRRTFRDGGVFPGDDGYLDGSGRLYVLGRSDLINVGGYKVDRVEVERVIRESLPVKDVIVVEGVRAGLPAVRVIVEADPTCVTRAMVVKVCRERLSSYKVPALVEIRERLERDASGKVLGASPDA